MRLEKIQDFYETQNEQIQPLKYFEFSIIIDVSMHNNIILLVS